MNRKEAITRIYSVLLGVGIFTAILAICFFVFHIPDFWPQLLAIITSAFLGAGATAWITNALLKTQRESEEEKDRNTKVFEKKLCIYQEFLHCLYEVIKDGEVTKEEAIRLEFQTSYITMHTRSEQIKNIAEQVKTIVEGLKEKSNPNDKTNPAETISNDNKLLMKCLFNIVEQFRKELYPDLIKTDPDRENNDLVVQAFGSIMDAVEVKEETSGSEGLSSEEVINLSQILTDFVNKLLKRLENKLANWTVKPGELEKGVYINFAYKGMEESVRVLFDYEESNGEHYFQVHLEHDDSHEVYKHMKWKFGGRQNKWSWWKYLDINYRSLANVEEINNRDWDRSLTYCETKLIELLSYVETFVKVRDEIYYKVPKDKANVWMYYNNYVVFDYDKSDKLFFDVIMENNSYIIKIGTRDNNETNLLEHLNQMGFKVKEQDLQDKRYQIPDNLTQEKAVAKLIELNSKL